MKHDSADATQGSGRYRIFQIYYNDASRATIHPDLIPLDNRDGRPDWFELWAIVRFLRENELDEDVWYGFVSPRFFEKLEISWPEVKAVLDARPSADVALFSSDWVSLAGVRNPWVYGEQFHPGLIANTREFLRHRGHDRDLKSLVTDFDTSVNSNYMIGKRAFWRLWLELAEDYLIFADAQDENSGHRAKAPHRGKLDYEMKVFVQERLASWILLFNPLIVTRPNYAFDLPLIPPTRKGLELILRWMIHICERSKHLARKTNSRLPLLGYHFARSFSGRLRR